mgnify:CR=1 FL=1
MVDKEAQTDEEPHLSASEAGSLNAILSSEMTLSFLTFNFLSKRLERARACAAAQQTDWRRIIHPYAQPAIMIHLPFFWRPGPD